MIELVYKDGGQEKVFPVYKEEIVLGRSPQADIVLNDHTVSCAHATISIKGNEITIHDAKIRNGTRVNKVSVLEAPLQPGDRVVLGNFELELREGQSAMESAPAPGRPRGPGREGRHLRCTAWSTSSTPSG